MKIKIERHTIRKNYKEYLSIFFKKKKKPLSILVYFVMIPFIGLGIMLFFISSLFSITFEFKGK